MQFDGKILIIGCGAVAQCTLPLIFKHIKIKPNNIIIIDPLDNRDSIADYIQKGVEYNQIAITHDNYDSLLGKYLAAGDICIDLANEVDTRNILEWCHTKYVHYLNSCLNTWHVENKDITFYSTYLLLQEFTKLCNKNDTTAILCHGANPGLISSFTKHAIVEIAQKIIHEKPNDKRVPLLKDALENKNFAQLAFLEQIKVIHVTEIDSQWPGAIKKDNEFVNTWSIPEFILECVAKAEFYWGTHEKKLPKDYQLKSNVVISNKRAMHSLLKSYNVDKEFIAITPAHDEIFSIGDYLSLPNEKYRPTLGFIYSSSLPAQESLKELESRDFIPQVNNKIIKKEIVTGEEKLGALLMGHDFNSWWTGSIISIEQSNKLVEGQNATLIQVAAGVISALAYIIEHPNKGICFPEELDYEFILKIAQPYLGQFVSKQVSWQPKTNTDWTFEDFLP
jgi:homospermidine synthase